MDSSFTEHLEKLFAAYGVPPEERTDILQPVLLKLVYLWGEIRDHEAWALSELRKQLEM